MNFYVLTLFPELIDSIVNTSITGRAIRKGVLRVNTVNIRDFSTRRDGRVDDYPYGGGAGMVMEPEPVAGAIASVKEKAPRARVVYLTPQGPVLTQTKAEELAREDDLVLLCGHYEGIDERVLEEYVTDYLSIGDYVLTGGELGAAVVIDAVSRFVPGVLPNEDSARFESLQDNLLEYPQYTRPVEWRGRKVPDVLLSGDHSAVDDWRAKESLKRTKERRPDLLKNHYRVFCVTAGGEEASTAGTAYMNAVSRLGEIFDFDRRKLQKSGWKFRKSDLAIFACSPEAMAEEERFRRIEGNGTPAVILLVTGHGAPETDPDTEAEGIGTAVNGSGTEAEGIGTTVNGSGTVDAGTGTAVNGSGTFDAGTGTAVNGSGTAAAETGGACDGMKNLLEQKGFRVIAVETISPETDGNAVSGMAISLREKLLQLS